MGKMAIPRKIAKISSGVMEMNFMKSAKIRLEELVEKKRKEVQEVRLHLDASTTIDEAEDISYATTSKSGGRGFEREDSYVKLMDLREFGRFSFGGFNPDVEKEMAYWDAKRSGTDLDEYERELEINDEEMAASAFGQKRLADRQNEERRLEFSYIEETTKSIKKFSTNKQKQGQYGRKRKPTRVQPAEDVEDQVKKSRLSD